MLAKCVPAQFIQIGWRPSSWVFSLELLTNSLTVENWVDYINTFIKELLVDEADISYKKVRLEDSIHNSFFSLETDLSHNFSMNNNKYITADTSCLLNN